MHLSSSLKVAAALGLLASAPAFADTLFSQATKSEGIPAGGQYVPPGNLYDNEQSDATTSLASQDSSGTATARSADDFIVPTGACVSNTFDVTGIRIQMVQSDAAPQAFAVDLYNDDGTGNAPTAGISPFVTLAQQAQTNLGVFGAGTSIFEASFVPAAPLQLTGGTKYWISGFGTNAALNAGGFNNFFAASAGATGTTDNGMIIAPGSGVPAWTLAHVVIGGVPLAFSFAIDGECVVGGGPAGTTFDVAVPTLSTIGIALLATLLAIGAFFMMRRS
jgi:hypothetical protein